MARTAAPRNAAELITEAQVAVEDALAKHEAAADRLRKAVKKIRATQKQMVADATPIIKPA